VELFSHEIGSIRFLGASNNTVNGLTGFHLRFVSSLLDGVPTI
jgi:hypothetical protein